MMKLLKDPAALIRHISQVLCDISPSEFFSGNTDDSPSAVLLLLGLRYEREGVSEPCLILNKRSRKVRQPGDLCCPGGSVTPVADPMLAKLLTLPGFPLTRWQGWRHWRDSHPDKARQMAIFLATGLRECFEEMRLNPLGIRFLGPLPSQHLRMFRRVIYPMAVWVSRQKRFVPNWEVEKVVHIPLRYLLNPSSYSCYRLEFSPYLKKKFNRGIEDYLCVPYQHGDEQELLWGATLRIVTVFLETVFGFIPPDLASLPVIPGVLEKEYLTGSV